VAVDRVREHWRLPGPEPRASSSVAAASPASVAPSLPLSQGRTRPRSPEAVAPALPQISAKVKGLAREELDTLINLVVRLDRSAVMGKSPRRVAQAFRMSKLFLGLYPSDLRRLLVDAQEAGVPLADVKNLLFVARKQPLAVQGATAQEMDRI